VAEDAGLAALVAHVSTSDADGGDNGRVHCGLVDSAEFQLVEMYEGEYKLVTAKRFDPRRTVDEYKVTISCHDMGHPQHVVDMVNIYTCKSFTQEL